MGPVSKHPMLPPSVNPQKLGVDVYRGTNKSPPAVGQDDCTHVMDFWYEEPKLVTFGLVAIVAYYLLRLTVLPKPFGDRLGGERWLCLIPQLILTIFHSNLVVLLNAFRFCDALRGEAGCETYHVKLRNSLEVKIFWISESLCALSGSIFLPLDIMTAFTESRALRNLLRYLAVAAVFFGSTACVFAYLCREFILNWPLYDKGYGVRIEALRRDIGARKRERVVTPGLPTANNGQAPASNHRNVTTVNVHQAVIINYGIIHYASGPARNDQKHR